MPKMTFGVRRCQLSCTLGATSSRLTASYDVYQEVGMIYRMHLKRPQADRSAGGPLTKFELTSLDSNVPAHATRLPVHCTCSGLELADFAGKDLLHRPCRGVGEHRHGVGRTNRHKLDSSNRATRERKFSTDSKVTTFQVSMVLLYWSG